MNEHTPGPWSMVRSSGDADLPMAFQIGIDAPDYEARDHHLATVVSGDPDELEANARLIAAAPDLYSALWAMFSSFHAVAWHEPHMKQATAMAEAALKKAEGRS